MTVERVVNKVHIAGETGGMTALENRGGEFNRMWGGPKMGIGKKPGKIAK